MTNVALAIPRSGFRVRALAVVLGALVVAGAAQISIPIPGTPVPMTLQPMAVLLVGGLLGAPLGALSMILYLAMGAAGLPVFTPTVPLVGLTRLFGPTGGYLLAYPVAAWVVGRFSDPGRQPGVPNLRGGALSQEPMAV
ncbi:MAG TPA: biotin transporter BioY, partial [Gemmatimonadales bacterium]|nr:biotin transporter BioY [Gemmatimonadales bacterium]